MLAACRITVFGASLSVDDGQRHVARTCGVVEDSLAGDPGVRRARSALAGGGVAIPAREGARGDLHPYAVACSEGDPGLPQVHAVLVDSPGSVKARPSGLNDPGAGITFTGLARVTPVVQKIAPSSGCTSTSRTTK